MITSVSRRSFVATAAMALGAAAIAGAASNAGIAASSTAYADEAADYGVTGAAALSASDYDFDGEYAYSDFNAHSQADTERQGVDTYSDTDIVFKIINYQELVELLDTEGAHLIEFGGGSWCHNTRAFSAICNQVAKDHGIDTIYTYDFDFDNNENGWTFIRMTNGTEYGVGVKWNYMYGEIVSRYLANLNDWVQLGQDSDYAIVYTNSDGEDITLPRLQEPYLVLYDKDNTKDNSGNGHDGQACPIVYAFEEMVDRDGEGIYLSQKDADGNETGREYITEDFTDRLSQLFDYIDDNDIKIEDFDEEASIKQDWDIEDATGLDIINYAQLSWLLGQDGSCLVAFADHDDDASKEIIAAAQKAAADAGAKVYVFDPLLDNNLVAGWGYDNTPNILSDPDLGYMFDDLVEDYLTNGDSLTLGTLFAYNKQALDEDGFAAPVFATATTADDVRTVIDAYQATI